MPKADVKRDTPRPAGATVRLYRQGLGDCTLVTLRPDNAPPYRILIDCGVYQTASGGKAFMRRVVEDVITQSDGFVDLLVATHEHYDHISGFNQADDLFARPGDPKPRGKLRVGQVWLAWTEDPDDRVGSRLETEKAKAFRGLEAAETLARGLLGPDPEAPRDRHAAGLAQGLAGVLGFFGAAGRTTRDAMTAIKTLAPTPVRYCRPSDAPFTEVPGVRIYALGPPLDPKAIFQLMAESEVYSAAPGGFQSDAFVDLLEAHAGGGDADLDPQQPFDIAQRTALDFARRADADPAEGRGSDTERFFEQHYWGASADTQQPDQQWRRIDSDWLGPASDLALKLDNATNNTSLVLAIELTRTGKVLLFPGDAQVGSWLSWGGLSWRLGPEQTVTGADLLKRVAFYKVGHHGSHNATLKAKGLELMDRHDLVAFIPVDETLAKKVGWGSMPLPGIETALKDRAGGRVVRTDRDFDPGALVAGDDFAERLTQTDLFYEIEIAG